MPHIPGDIAFYLMLAELAGWLAGGYFGWRLACRADLFAHIFRRQANPAALLVALPVAGFTLATAVSIVRPVAFVTIAFGMSSVLWVLGWALFFMVPYMAGHSLAYWWFSPRQSNHKTA